MKKVIAILLVMALSLPLVANPVLAAKNNESKGNSQKSTKVVSEVNEKKQLLESIDSSKKNEIKDKLQNEEVSKQEFKDSKNHWANKAIETSKKLGWIKGYPDGTFKPQDSVSTLEIIVIAMKVADDLVLEVDPLDEDEAIEDENENEDDTEDLDVPEWAEDAFDKAIKQKVINVNRFHSHVQATRAQAVVTLAKALGYEPVDTTESNFIDSELILAEDLGYILALLEAGVITGTPDGKFNPNNSITRGEIATILANIAAVVVEEPETTDEEEPSTDEEEPSTDETVVDPIDDSSVTE